MSEPLAVIAWAGIAGFAAVLGALLALWYRPTTILMSVAFGFAGGVVLATVAFEMVPRAQELASVLHSVLGFAAGFIAVYVLDLFLNYWRVAGPCASEHGRVEAFHRRRPPRADQPRVLATGTSIEEVIEGIAIGVGVSVGESVGFLLALAIAIDNVTESFSVGAMIRDRAMQEGGDQPHLARTVVAWSAAPGLVVFCSAILGWALLGGLSDSALGVMLAFGGGALFYLAVTDFIPEAEERQYQQSGAVGAAVGFLAIYALSSSI